MTKKKIIKVIIMITLTLVIIGATVFGIVKYKADNRYLQYEELKVEQVIFVQVQIGTYYKQKQVYVRALDVEGNLYATLIPYEEWEGIEAFYDEITEGKLREDYKSTEKMETLYGSLLQIDKYVDYIAITDMFVEMPGEAYYYGIRYMINGEREYVKFWEDRRDGGYYLLDDDYAGEIYYSLGNIL